MSELSKDYELELANVFHAGDGNLHPLIMYDANKEGELDRAERFGADILRLCVEVGGVLTGEHGVGVEKRDLMEVMFNEDDLNQQQRVKCAFDPGSLLNPGKMFPRLHRCAGTRSNAYQPRADRLSGHPPILKMDAESVSRPESVDQLSEEVRRAAATETKTGCRQCGK